MPKASSTEKLRRHKKRMEDPEYRRRYREKKRRRYKLHRISDEQFQEMVNAQGERCLICQRKVRLGVDHDHETGAVRGLLCDLCNRGLGYFKDDPVRLKRAISYLMDEREVT